MIRALTVLLLALVEAAQAFGLGIDWGSEYHKSTMLTGSGFRMVENHVSARKTPSMLSLCGEERFFENQAVSKFSRAACDTFYMLDRHSERLAEALRASPGLDAYLDPRKPQRDAIGAVFLTGSALLKGFGRNTTGLSEEPLAEPFVRWEEVLGMMLENERANAAKTGKTEWKSAVFTIRDNSLSVRERKALDAAAALSGLTASAFVHENTAAMVYSSMDRPESEAPLPAEDVLVINVGSFATKLSLLRIEYVPGGDAALNATRHHPLVRGVKDFHSNAFSGHLLDVCLADFALAKQLKTLKRAVPEAELALFKRRRLYTEIKKAKETLSANKEITFNVEDFFEDRPLQVKLSRAEFEEACEPLFAAFEALVVDFLLTVDRQNIRKVEIIGGGVRVPRVQEILREKFKLPLSQTINGDEGPAHGAAYIAANATAGLKMKKVLMLDGPNYKVDLAMEFPGEPEREPKQAELFALKASYGAKKKITVARLAASALVRLTVPHPGDFEVVYNVTGAQKGLDKFADRNVTEWKAAFFFQLDPLGVPRLNSAELHLKESVAANRTVDVTRTNETDNSTFNETVTEAGFKTVNLTHRLTVEVVSQSYAGLHERRAQFEESKALLRKIRAREEERLLLAELKNKLESFVYRLKSEAADPDDRRFLTDAEAERFLNKSAEIDEFLFEGDPSNITRENVETLTLDAEDLAHLLHFRKVEARERPRVVQLWAQFLLNCTDAIAKIKEERPWIPDERLEELREAVEAAKTEVADLMQKQETLPLNKDPVLRTGDLSDRVKALSAKINKASRIPKPKEPKNATEDLDGMLRETMRKMKFNMTGENMTDDQIDELLRMYQERKEEGRAKPETGDSDKKSEGTGTGEAEAEAEARATEDL